MNSLNSISTRWLTAILILLAAGFIALNLLAFTHAQAMTRYTPSAARTAKPESLDWGQKFRVLLTGVTVPRPVAARQPAELDPACRRVTIDAPDGIRLGAWHVDRGPSVPLVILFHGYAAEKTSLLNEAKRFLNLGLSVLLVDFRGSGESSESYTTLGYREAYNVKAAMDFAQTGLNQSAIVLFGQSMGAVAISCAVHRHSLEPDAVILESVFDTLRNTIRNRFDAMGVPSFPGTDLLVFWGGVQAGFNGFTHNPSDYARSIACPLLVMHGSDDPRVRPAEGRRVFEAASSTIKTFREFPDTGHESFATKDPELWKRTVSGFLNQSRLISAPIVKLPVTEEFDHATLSAEETAALSAARSRSSGLHRISGAVRAPDQIKKPAFQAPPNTEPPHRFTGSLYLVDVVIDEAGIPRDPIVVRRPVIEPPWPEFEKAVLASILDWRYRPATLEDKPVAVSLVITVLIHL